MRKGEEGRTEGQRGRGGDVSEGRTACVASHWRTWNDVAGSCFLRQGGKKSAASTHQNTPTSCAGTSGVGFFYAQKFELKIFSSDVSAAA